MCVFPALRPSKCHRHNNHNQQYNPHPNELSPRSKEFSRTKLCGEIIFATEMSVVQKPVRKIFALDVAQTRKFLLEIALDILHDDRRVTHLTLEEYRPVALLLAAWIREINPLVGTTTYDFYKMIVDGIAAEITRVGTNNIEALIRAGLVGATPTGDTRAKIVVDQCNNTIPQCVDQKSSLLKTSSNYFDVGGYSQVCKKQRFIALATIPKAPANVTIGGYTINYSAANSRKFATTKDGPIFSGSHDDCNPARAASIQSKDYYILGDFEGESGNVSAILAYRSAVRGTSAKGDVFMTFQFKVSNAQPSIVAGTDKVLYGWSRSAREMSDAMSAWRAALPAGEWSRAIVEHVLSSLGVAAISCLCVDVMTKFWGDFGFVCEVLGVKEAGRFPCPEAVVTGDKHLAGFCNMFGVCFIWSGVPNVMPRGEYAATGNVRRVDDRFTGGPFVNRTGLYYSREETGLINRAWK